MLEATRAFCYLPIRPSFCQRSKRNSQNLRRRPRWRERSGHFRQTSSGEVNFQTSVSRASRNNLASNRVCSAGDDVTNRRRNSATVKGSSQRKYGTTEGSVRSVERETLIVFSPPRFDDRLD